MPVELALLEGRKATVPTQCFINNEWVDAVGGETFDVINPATAEVIAQVASGQTADVDNAVKAARKAFNTTWGRNVAPEERSRLLHKLADLMERDQQHLGELESVNSGKVGLVLLPAATSPADFRAPSRA